MWPFRRRCAPRPPDGGHLVAPPPPPPPSPPRTRPPQPPSLAASYWRLQSALATTLLPDVVRLEALAAAAAPHLPPADAARLARLRARTLTPLLARLRAAPGGGSDGDRTARPPTRADLALLRRAAAVIPPYAAALRAVLVGRPPAFDVTACCAAAAA